MPKVTPSRQYIFFEEVESGSAVSEDTLSKIGSSVNFWNESYEGSRGWFLNGDYWIYGPQSGLDGAYVTLMQMEICGIGVYNLIAGTSGTTEFDLTVHPPTGPSYSLFSTRPAIPFVSGNNARIIHDAINNNTLFASSGATVPVLAHQAIPAGSMVTFSTTSVQTGARNCGLILYMRPYG